MELIPSLPNELALECLVRIPHNSFSSVGSVCRSWMVQMEQPEFWRHRHTSGFTQRLIVMSQARGPHPGNNKPASSYRLTILEPETGCWAELPSIPGYSDGLPMFCQLVGVGLSLVVIGGLSPVSWEIMKEVHVYDFVSGAWRRGADMPGCRRSFFGCCASDSVGMVFVAGGHDDDKNALRSALAYDVSKDKWIPMPDMAKERDECKGVWIPMPDMAKERDECKGVLQGGKFHVIGGYDTNTQGGFGTSAESFDVAKWQWDAQQDDFLASPTYPAMTCMGSEDNKLYMCHDSDVLALENLTWHFVSELPPEVRNVAYVTAWQGKLVVIGSSRCNEPYTCCVLELRSRTWIRMVAPHDFSGHVQSGCCLQV